MWVGRRSKSKGRENETETDLRVTGKKRKKEPGKRETENSHPLSKTPPIKCPLITVLVKRRQHRRRERI